MDKKLLHIGRARVVGLGRESVVLLYFFAAGVVFDFSKQIVTFSSAMNSLFEGTGGAYLLSNGLALVMSLAVRILVRNNLVLYPLIGAAFGVVGYTNSAFLAVGIITVVWHGVIGFFAALTFLFRSLFGDLESSLATINPGDEKRILSLKDDLWAFI